MGHQSLGEGRGGAQDPSGGRGGLRRRPGQPPPRRSLYAALARHQAGQHGAPL